jgi:gluconolactonase
MTTASAAIFCTGLRLPEGPVLLPDGSWLVTELARARGCVTHIDPSGQEKRIVARTGRPNGLAVDREGVVWVAESLHASVVRLTLDGSQETWATTCGSEPLLWPNDICIGPDGDLFVTDSGIRVTEFLDGDAARPDALSLALNGKVCRFDAETRAGEVIDRGLQFANGIAFGPDGALYANETMTGNVYRYDLDGGAERELYGNVLDPDCDYQGLRGPDGMKFGASGRLYVAVFGQGDVTVLGLDGEVVARHRAAGLSPTNLAFGPPGSRQAYVVEDENGQIQVLDVDDDGLPLHG